MSMFVVSELHASLPQDPVLKMTPSSATNGVLDTLVVEGRTLKLYHGVYKRACILQKKYKFDTNVLDSFWCYFDDGARNEKVNIREKNSTTLRKKCLCVREKGLLTFIMPGGQMYHLPLPFLVKGAWPLSEGLLVERCLGDHDLHGDGLSTLFTLTHPMNELCPLSCRRNEAIVSYFTNPMEHVVAVSISDNFSIIVLFNGSAHSIYEIKPAQTTDIPSPLPSTPSRRNASSILCTPQPLSSSAPARYAHISPGSPLKFSLKVEPSPKQQSTVGNIGSCGRRSLYFSPGDFKHKALQRVKKDTPLIGSGRRSSPRVTSSIVDNNTSMKSSGRSPFIDRYKTPTESTRPKWQKRRSESPAHFHGGRISPYSLVLNSLSWSKFYSESETPEGEYGELQPQYCLHLMWTEDSTPLLAHPVSELLIVKDCVGVQYMTLLVKSINRIFFLSFTRDEGRCSVGQSVIAVIEGVKSALYLESVEMSLVLMLDGSLVLYNGVDRVCNIDTSVVFETGTGTGPESVSSINNSIRNEFLMVTGNDHAFLCTIDYPITHEIVRLSIDALCRTLCDNSMKKLILSRTYHIFSKCSSGLDSQWTLFCKWLLTSLNIPIEYYDSLTAISTNTDSALNDLPFYNLLATSFPMSNHSCVIHQPTINISPDMSVPLSHCVYNVLSLLHLLYEEVKLNIHFHHYLKDIAVLLYVIARCHGWNAYVDHYVRDHPLLLNHTMTDSMITGEWTDSHSSMDENESLYTRNGPPGIYQWIHSILNNETVEPYPVLCGTFNVTEKIVKVYSHLVSRCYDNVHVESLYEVIGHAPTTAITNDMETSTSPSSSRGASIALHQEIVDLLVNEGMSTSVISSLPVGVCTPLHCILLQCKTNPSLDWSPEVYGMTGRSDVQRTLHRSKGLSEFLKLEIVNEDTDGMDIDEEIYKLKFPSDCRIREVKRLLQSSKPVRIALVQNPEMSDHEFVDLQKSRLLNVSQRTMSLSIGRGMFTMATAKPMLFSAMKIPKLNLSGQAPPRNSPISLEPSDYPSDMTVWPEFHNGVSTALKLDAGIENIDSTWIILNQPSDDKSINAYAGFLMGLGLNGHLNSLNPYNLYDYLQQKHEVTVIGLLLGMSAAKCGSMDLSIASILSVFLPPLLPKGSVDLETSVLMQSAAMFSLGLVYMNSCNRFIAETLLKQIGHSPGPELEFAQNRECYSLTAGLALGMVALGDGINSVGLGDLHIEDQLFHYINGGKKQSLFTRDIKSPSFLVMEDEQINTHVTAPGAILALGLLYLKTNNSNIADRLTPPTTPYQLESIRPDFLMLRVLCYGLIMWDSVSPTHDWIHSLIPEIVNTHAFEAAASISDGPSSNDIDYQTMCQSKLYIIAGACLALGFRYAGTYRQDAYQCLLSVHKQMLKYQNLDYIGKTCMESFVCAVMLALSMVNSGSGDIETLRLVRLYHVRTKDLSYGKHMAIHMALGLLFLGGGRYCLSRSKKAIAVLLCSLYPHFPLSTTDNRYHLQALRHLYVLACEPRILVTREADTGQPCTVPITISDANHSSSDVVTPCVIPEDISAIDIVTDPRYLPVKYDMKNELVKNSIMKSGYIFVKRHVAYAPYATDPQGNVSRLSLATSLQHQFGSVCQYNLSTIKQLFRDRHLNNVFMHLYYSNKAVYTTLLINCVHSDQTDLLHLLMELNECLLDTTSIDSCGLKLWNLKLCRSFLKAAKCSPALSNINEELTSLNEYVNHIYAKLNLKTDLNNKDLSKLSLAYLLKNKLPHSMTQSETKALAITLQTMALLPAIPQQTQVDCLLKKMYEDRVSPSLAAKTILAISFHSTQSNSFSCASNS